jgi:hypothetical protein
LSTIEDGDPVGDVMDERSFFVYRLKECVSVHRDLLLIGENIHSETRESESK